MKLMQRFDGRLTAFYTKHKGAYWGLTIVLVCACPAATAFSVAHDIDSYGLFVRLCLAPLGLAAIFSPLFAMYLVGHALEKLPPSVSSELPSVILGLLFGAPLVVPWLASIVIFSASQDRFQQNLHAYENAFLAGTVAELRNTPVFEPAQQRKLKRPVILCETKFGDTASANKRPVMSDVTLRVDWFKFAFEDRLVRLLNNRRWTPLPSITPQGFMIVVNGSEKTAHWVALDNGAVPEIRHYAIVYAVAPEQFRIVGQSPRIWGAHATKPSLGPGTHLLSEVHGPEPAWDDIYTAVQNLLED